MKIPVEERRAAYRTAANVLRLAVELDKLGLPRVADDAGALAPIPADARSVPGARVTFTPITPPRSRRDIMADAVARAHRARPDRIAVGVCDDECGSPVFYSPAAGCALCACGAVDIPAAFFNAARASWESNGARHR